MTPTKKNYDFVIIGSGFGGSVSAMRLAEKGHKVAVLEMGKHFSSEDFPKSNWSIFKYLWAPVIRCFGIQKISLLRKVMVLHGVGVGGGSLVYANTLMQPEPYIFENPLWPKDINWIKELRAPFQRAKKMLGVVTNPFLFDGEQALKKVGAEMGIEHTFHPTEVGVFFGDESKKNSDPYFEGKGPLRNPCTACGACMIGCREGAKNTLDKNYLYFAQQSGAEIFSETMVESVVPAEGGYLVQTKSSTKFFNPKKSVFYARKVIVSAGVLGTVRLLLRNKTNLPQISNRLGDFVKTNNESLLGVTCLSDDKKMDKGVAIGAAIHPDSETKIEAVRYPKGSDLMRLLAVPLTGPGNFFIRPLKLCAQLLSTFPQYMRLMLNRNWAGRSLILLVMQSIETNMTLKLGVFGKLRGKSVAGEQVPSYLPVAQEAAKKLAQVTGGVPQNIFSEVLLQTPATAHILGGAIMGKNKSEGVVDVHHEVFGHPGLYICDASVIPSNLAVNPSLTIVALAERFCEQF